MNFGAVVGRDTWFDLSRLDEMYAKKIGGLLLAEEEEGDSIVPAKVVALQEQLKARLARYTELKDEKTRIKEEMSRLRRRCGSWVRSACGRARKGSGGWRRIWTRVACQALTRMLGGGVRSSAGRVGGAGCCRA